MARKGKPWKFFRAYCDYTTNEYGWTADGSTARAETELKERLKLCMIQRPREVIWANTPPKTRQVIRIDVEASDDGMRRLSAARSEGNLFSALERTLEYKMDAICEKVLEDLGVGDKAVVWCLTRQSVEMMTQALEGAINERQVATLMRQQRVRLWATHGEADVKARNQLAATFREHQGGCVLVATMDSMPESISLKGAHSEHFAQLHFLPGPMFQAENRPYDIDVRGLTLFYYIARKTVDEHVENIILPRLAMMDKLAGESDASGLGSVLGTKTKEESLQEVLARLFGDASEDGRADFGVEESDADFDGSEGNDL